MIVAAVSLLVEMEGHHHFALVASLKVSFGIDQVLSDEILGQLIARLRCCMVDLGETQRSADDQQKGSQKAFIN